MVFSTLGFNPFSILLASFAGMALGMLWYSPLLFGTQWMKARGLDKKSLAKQQKEMGVKYLLSFGSIVVTACMLSLFMAMFGAMDLNEGLSIALMSWFGFTTTVQLTNWIYSGKPKELYYIDTGYQFVMYLLMGLILILWK